MVNVKMLFTMAVLGAITQGAFAAPIEFNSVNPNGSYPSGRNSVMTPNGNYVKDNRTEEDKLSGQNSYGSGDNTTSLCPDGTYVSGKWCHLQPDGSYKGK